MIAGFTEDFTSGVVLDSQLTAAPESGLYFNQATHPSITIGNLLSFLPFQDVTPATWSNATTYGKYEDTKKRSDLVTHNGVIYQSLQASNLNKQPDTQTSWWLPTNNESLKLKSFIDRVTARVYSELHLTKRLVNNQYLYNAVEIGEPSTYTLPADYSAWVFEPKGSDYVTIRLNQVSFQKEGTDPVTMYVLNQGKLITTKTVTPSDGIVEFKDFGYSFTGKGQWKFVIESTEVVGRPAYIDTLSYDGFVAYTMSGIGNDVEDAKWSYSNMGNGIGWNVSVYLDASSYIDNNMDAFGGFVRAAFEMEALQMFLANANNRDNREQQIQMNEDRLIYETTDLSGFTVAKRYVEQKRLAMDAIKKAFDTQLSNEDGLTLSLGSV